MASALGADNPLRYRGYIYDTETGLYYLSSRYYDPEVGRFINADDQVQIGGDLAGVNLFAYCGNNPVNCIDPAGHALVHWVIAATVVAVAAAAVVVTAGGALPALLAVASVANGVAAATTASTVAAAAFIGSATYLGGAAISAAASSSSARDFNAQGSWRTVARTAGSAFLAGGSAYVATRGSSLGSKAASSPISNSDAKRIQNAANRTNQNITVVGSRANGTAGPNSDWDYIMSGNSAQRHSAASSVPRGIWGERIILGLIYLVRIQAVRILWNLIVVELILSFSQNEEVLNETHINC